MVGDPHLELEGWLPIRLFREGDAACVDWCYLGRERLVDPFFDHTIDRVLRRPFPLLFRRRTGVDALLAAADSLPEAPPAGFVFHMSRCGSTLLAQLLATSPAHVVVSEASVVDAVLRPDPRVSDEQRVAWLRALLAVLGRARNPAEQRCFVKFEPWHTVHLPLIRCAFPDVPSVFVYRDPVEVLVSLASVPGGRLVPGAIDPALLGMDLPQVLATPSEEYHARVLAAICAAAIDTSERDPRGLRVVEYPELPDVVWTELAGFFGFACSDADVRVMKERATRDAKQGHGPFTPDAETRQRAASDALRAAADRWVRPCYDQLESQRLASARPPRP